MISLFSKRLLPLAVTVFSVVSCSKDNADPSSMLMKKAWSPYQVEIQTIDSNWTNVTDKSTGGQTKTSAVIKSDTLYTVSDCQQNSVYQFKSNNVQILSDACTPNSKDYTTTWGLTPARQLSFSQFVTGLITVTGSLTEINSAQFVFNNVRNMSAFGNTTDASGNAVSTTDQLNITTILTFKSIP